jgi:hypothetical protein
VDVIGNAIDEKRLAPDLSHDTANVGEQIAPKIIGDQWGAALCRKDCVKKKIRESVRHSVAPEGARPF